MVRVRLCEHVDLFYVLYVYGRGIRRREAWGAWRSSQKTAREKILVRRTEALARPIPGSMSWRAPRDTLARLSCGWASR